MKEKIKEVLKNLSNIELSPLGLQLALNTKYGREAIAIDIVRQLEKSNIWRKK